ncbi:MAG TPA: hypothetical protein VI893_09945, partial [Thermoplasmata archaeon]|nr:hypothetical protein [Thermoplasmata archaeon]
MQDRSGLLGPAPALVVRAAPAPHPLTQVSAYDPGPIESVVVARGSSTWAVSGGPEDPWSADRDVYFARNTSSGMLPPTRVSGQVGDELYPHLTYDPSGKLHVAYSMPGAGNELDVAHARSTDGGLTWTVTRLAIVDKQRVTDIEASANGSLWIAYTDDVRDQVVGLLYSSDGGVTWVSAGIQFGSPQVRMVRNTKLDSINNGTSGALFMSGLLQFQGNDVLPVYYNDKDGSGAANWVIRVFTAPLPGATGPWADGSAG